MTRIYNVQTAAAVQQAGRLAQLAGRSDRPDLALATAVEVLLDGAEPDALQAILQVVDEARGRLEPPGAEVSVPDPVEAGQKAEGLPAGALGQPGHAPARSEAETLTSAEVGDLLGSSSANRRQYAMELRQRGVLVGVRRKNAYVYPRFQFDQPRRRVHPVVERINRLLGAGRDPWRVLAWWTSPNGRLSGDRAPRDLLDDGSDSGTLIELAEAAVAASH